MFSKRHVRLVHVFNTCKLHWIIESWTRITGYKFQKLDSFVNLLVYWWGRLTDFTIQCVKFDEKYHELLCFDQWSKSNPKLEGKPQASLNLIDWLMKKTPQDSVWVSNELDLHLKVNRSKLKLKTKGGFFFMQSNAILQLRYIWTLIFCSTVRFSNKDF